MVFRAYPKGPSRPRAAACTAWKPCCSGAPGARQASLSPLALREGANPADDLDPTLEGTRVTWVSCNLLCPVTCLNRPLLSAVRCSRAPRPQPVGAGRGTWRTATDPNLSAGSRSGARSQELARRWRWHLDDGCHCPCLREEDMGVKRKGGGDRGHPVGLEGGTRDRFWAGRWGGLPRRCLSPSWDILAAVVGVRPCVPQFGVRHCCHAMPYPAARLGTVGVAEPVPIGSSMAAGICSEWAARFRGYARGGPPIDCGDSKNAAEVRGGHNYRSCLQVMSAIIDAR